MQGIGLLFFHLAHNVEVADRLHPRYSTTHPEVPIATLELSGIEASKEGTPILRGIDLTADDGELIAVVGPSGSGKSTLLHVAAGLLKPTAGTVSIGGFDMTSKPASARNVGMVFQDNVVYPMRTVAGNVGFPLEIQHRPKHEIAKRVSAEGRAMHLEQLMDRDPSELSAGHQQLVQIARALVRAPSLFLMDEPLARLDAHLRVEMRSELRMMQRGYGVTTLYVTNDPAEAMAVSDRLAVLADGKLAQIGTPGDVYHHPVSRTVSQIVGDLSTVKFRVRADDSGYWLERPGHRIRAWAPALDPYVNQDVEVGFRPEHLAPSSPGITCAVERVMHQGSQVITVCRVDSDMLRVRSEEPFADPGDTVDVAATGGHVFAQNGQTIATW